MTTCPQELCQNWTGQGCACALLDLEPSVDLDEGLSGLSEFTANPEPLTFEELVWACDICGWAVDLCTEHRAMAREINAEQDEDARREAGDDW